MDSVDSPRLEEVFKTASSVEAEVVRGLLEAHGIETMVASALSPSVFPIRLGHPEFKISVAQTAAQRSRLLIAAHLDEAAAGEVRRLSENLGPLESRIGYEFRDLGLLEHALTHRSRAHEDASGGVIDNESMEFLGDAVLGFVIADLLFTQFPAHDEGYKSKVKAGIVSAASLARLASDIDLGRYVLLGRGEEKTGGRGKHAILADSFEALIAAIYLDGGIEAARTFILSKFGPLVEAAGDRAAEATFTEDWKSELQEWLQAEGLGLPRYRVAAAEGPDHRKRFDVEVLVGGTPAGRASGRSKKDAEQQAARAALGTLRYKGEQTMKGRTDQGFTLIELLIVVAIISIIAAIAVPGLMSAKVSGNEASAITSLRAECGTAPELDVVRQRRLRAGLPHAGHAASGQRADVPQRRPRPPGRAGQARLQLRAGRRRRFRRRCAGLQRRADHHRLPRDGRAADAGQHGQPLIRGEHERVDLVSAGPDGSGRAVRTALTDDSVKTCL
jgi:ribonuclease-3